MSHAKQSRRSYLGRFLRTSDSLSSATSCIKLKNFGERRPEEKKRKNDWDNRGYPGVLFGLLCDAAAVFQDAHLRQGYDGSGE